MPKKEKAEYFVSRPHGQLQLHAVLAEFSTGIFHMRKPSLVVLQGAFTAINLLGIYRWANF